MDSIGNYEYNKKDLIGHGAFAIVYKGRQKTVNLFFLPINPKRASKILYSFLKNQVESRRGGYQSNNQKKSRQIAKSFS